MNDRLILLTYYHETNVLKALSSYKTASSENEVIDGLKSYFDSKIDQNNKLDWLINNIAPGGLFLLANALGFGKIGAILSLAMSVFHIDVAGIISSIWNSLKPSLEKNQPVSSSQVTSAVNSAFSGVQEPAQLQSENSLKLLTLALHNQEQEIFKLKHNLIKNAAGTSFNTTSNLLKKIIKYVFLVGLASAGFMVAGDVINKILGRNNSIDHNYQAGKPSSQISQLQTSQTKFPLKQDQPLPSSISAPNNADSIQKIIIQFAKDTYSGLENKDQQIISSPAFQNVLRDIVWYNSSFQGSPTVYFPANYTSKKKLTDFFIDDVAKNS